jgi:hypothetical protein
MDSGQEVFASGLLTMMGGGVLRNSLIRSSPLFNRLSSNQKTMCESKDKNATTADDVSPGFLFGLAVLFALLDALII